MQKTKNNIGFKLITLVLALALLVPTVYKFAHIFAHHEHDICLGETSTHLHEINTDCDFYKFNLSPSYTIPSFNTELITFQEEHLAIVSQYQFLSKFQKLQTSLRGPPSLI